MTPKIMLITLASSVAIAFTSGWIVNGWRWSVELAEQREQYSQALAKANALALSEYQQMEQEKTRALDQAALEAQINLNANLAARSELERLRRDLSTSSVTTASLTSLRAYTSTLQTLFGECSSALEEMGRTADGHALDSRTLRNSWPRRIAE